ncbi:MAG TPA: hypothetical protein ENF20_01555 [Candidatus Marinimicrobia bacterium]|nr:hypothetical protein [Candidatus Neomarinimicrobiota bacterium]
MSQKVTSLVFYTAMGFLLKPEARFFMCQFLAATITISGFMILFGFIPLWIGIVIIAVACVLFVLFA